MAMLIQAKLTKLTKVKKQRYKFVPYIFTYLNALCGFLAILKALDGDTVRAALLILVAACMDAIDGRLARALGSTSYFGMELDSLCDAISFCLAPAVAVYCSFVDCSLGLGGKILLAFYVCAGLARLAKFNTTAEKQHDYFSGLPTTMAAFFISQLLIYQSWLEMRVSALLFHKSCLLLVMTCLALLMISSVKFYSFKSVNMRLLNNNLVSMCALVTCILCAILMIKGYPIFLLLLLGYICTYSVGALLSSRDL